MNIKDPRMKHWNPNSFKDIDFFFFFYRFGLFSQKKISRCSLLECSRAGRQTISVYRETFFRCFRGKNKWEEFYKLQWQSQRRTSLARLVLLHLNCGLITLCVPTWQRRTMTATHKDGRDEKFSRSTFFFALHPWALHVGRNTRTDALYVSRRSKKLIIIRLSAVFFQSSSQKNRRL